MEIDKYGKALALAPYIGNDIKIENDVAVMCGINMFGQIETDNGLRWDIETDDIKLTSIKPLNAISNEDAIEVAKILAIDYDNNETSEKHFDLAGFRVWINELFTERFAIYTGTGNEILMCIYCLQAKNYDLPNFHLNGQTLKEAGLAIYP